MSVSTKGWIRSTGLFAMSTVVCPLRATAGTVNNLLHQVEDHLVVATGGGYGVPG